MNRIAVKGGALVAKITDSVIERIGNVLAQAAPEEEYDLIVHTDLKNPGTVTDVTVGKELVHGDAKIYIPVEDRVVETIVKPRRWKGVAPYPALSRAFACDASLFARSEKIASPQLWSILRDLWDKYGAQDFPHGELVSKVRETVSPPTGPKVRGVLGSLFRNNCVVRLPGTAVKLTNRAATFAMGPKPATKIPKAALPKETKTKKSLAPVFYEIINDLRTKHADREFPSAELVGVIRGRLGAEATAGQIGGTISGLRKSRKLVLRGKGKGKLFRLTAAEAKKSALATPASLKTEPLPPRNIKLFGLGAPAAPDKALSEFQAQSALYVALRAEREKLAAEVARIDSELSSLKAAMAEFLK